MIADSGKMGLDWWGPVQSHPRPHRSWSRKPLVSDWGGRSGFLTSWFLRPPSRFSKLCTQPKQQKMAKKTITMSTQRKRGEAKKMARCYKGRWRHLNTMACLAAADNSPLFNTNWISFFLSVDNFQWRDNRPRSALLRKNPRQNKQNSISIGTMLIKWHTLWVTKIFL